MNAGELRHSITIESLTRSADDMGGGTDSWATAATCFARIKPASAREIAFAAKRELRVTHSVRIRYQAGVGADQRINFGGRYFHIHSVMNWEERNIWLDLLAEEGAAS